MRVCARISYRLPMFPDWIHNLEFIFMPHFTSFRDFHSHGGTPIAGWFIREHPIKMGCLGGTPISVVPHEFPQLEDQGLHALNRGAEGAQAPKEELHSLLHLLRSLTTIKEWSNTI